MAVLDRRSAPDSDSPARSVTVAERIPLLLFGLAVVLAEASSVEIGFLFAIAAAASMALLGWNRIAAWRPGPWIFFPLIGGLGFLPLSSQPVLFSGHDLLRDLFIVTSVASSFAIGQIYGVDRRMHLALLRTLYLAGLALAMLHLVRIGVAGTSASGLYQYRSETGTGSLAEVVALLSAFLIQRRDGVVFRRLPAAATVFCHLLVILSVLASFSRTLIVSGAVFVVAGALCARAGGTGGDGRRRRYLGMAFAAASVAAIAGVAIFWSQSASIVDTLLAKFSNSLTETSLVTDNSKLAVVENYRGYEAYRALLMFQSGSLSEQIFGYGWGSSIDLVANTAASNADFTRSEAAILHNGYLYYLVKTGLLGVSLYACFILWLAITAVRRIAGQVGRSDLDVYAGLIGGVVILGVDSYSVGGFAAKSGFFSIAALLGASSALVSSATVSAPEPTRSP